MPLRAPDLIPTKNERTDQCNFFLPLSSQPVDRLSPAGSKPHVPRRISNGKTKTHQQNRPAQKSRKDSPESSPAAKSTANQKPSPKEPRNDDAAKIGASKRSAVLRLHNSRKASPKDKHHRELSRLSNGRTVTWRRQEKVRPSFSDPPKNRIQPQ
jgi:hypothetical protein